jgi:HAD superfamily hydrolase (TIGR01509 family)
VSRPKPSPEGYLFLISKFNFHVKDVIIVEDSPKGIEAATATGCHVKVVKDASYVNINLFKEIM